MNIGIFTGNLGRDPELRQHDGQNILNFPLGVQTGTKDKPETMWVDCAIWGKRATSLQQYMQKGSRVTVSGPLRMEAFTARDGSTKSALRMTIDQIDLPPRPAQDHGAPKQPALTQPQRQPGNTIDDMDDDIPF